MEFDVYCPPPTSKEIDTQRTRYKAQRKNARFFSVLLVAAWGVGMGFLWKLNFAPQNIIFGIAGGMVALTAISLVLGGFRAAVAAAASMVAALASTAAVVAVITYRNDLPIAVYAGLGGGFLLGSLCMLVGSRLHAAQRELRLLKPVPVKKKVYGEVVELSKKHPVIEAYLSKVTMVDRPLIKGEVAAMKAWAARASRMSAAAAVPAEPEKPAAPEETTPAGSTPEPEAAQTTPSVIELPGPEPEPHEAGPDDSAKPEAGEVVEGEILPEEKKATPAEPSEQQKVQ
ncbi:hypothetical protein DESUT3_21080 [Desulfuromonas versatilis]|uniref:Transmembrane protein n=1 Tax=Desulfuromonas versatilis TaxID=2802975 RepID=A0ABM8HVD8_9BACT|nr:hypothetical protein [Desulfuromonas versatilis]BCR05039.1 hypothetical protein DESUT3_21080 [Desulfuromonas versatilis]